MSGFMDLREKGFDTDAALRFTGGEDKYILALNRFYDAYEKNRSKIEGYHEAGDLESYSMLVHSLKSNARMIGANDLGDMAETLQYASQDKDTATVDEYNEVMLLQYQEVRDIIEPYAKKTQDSSSKTNQLLDKLKEALNNYDHKASLEAYNELLILPWEHKKQTILNDIKDKIDAFDYDEAEELLAQLSE